MTEEPLTTAAVLRQSGLSRAMFYNYIDVGLIHPAETSATGHRRFTADTLAKIQVIQGLQALGYSLRDIRETFKRGFAPPSS